jgi:hypothetical protein
MDRLTKSTHFIPVNTNYNVQKYAEIYIARVLCLHGVPKMIVSDRGSQFVARFWEQLHTSLEMHLIHQLQRSEVCELLVQNGTLVDLQ